MLAGHKAALQYARQHFARFKDFNMPEIQRLMGSLCYTRRQSSSPYAEFNSPAQWDDVAHEFTRQCCGLLGQVYFYLSVSFHFIPYSLGCGASCNSSDILTLKHRCVWCATTPSWWEFCLLRRGFKMAHFKSAAE